MRWNREPQEKVGSWGFEMSSREKRRYTVRWKSWLPTYTLHFLVITIMLELGCLVFCPTYDGSLTVLPTQSLFGRNHLIKGKSTACSEALDPSRVYSSTVFDSFGVLPYPLSRVQLYSFCAAITEHHRLGGF